LSTALTNKELEHLLDFIGYGRLCADVWFLGMEEGMEKSMEEGGGVEENIRTRLEFKQVEDCAEAHKILGITKYHWGKKIIQRTWRGMCYIMLSLEGKPVDKESIRNYQADHLGRFHGKSLMCELMPIPNRRTKDWGYETLIPQFKSREEYDRIVRPSRVKLLREKIQKYRPKIVVCYGKVNWQAYKELFPELEFSENGHFLVACDTNMVIVLTNHFASPPMNPYKKFDEVVSIIKERMNTQERANNACS